MDAALARLIAPTVQSIEDAWGKSLEDFDKLCILAGYQQRLDEEIADCEGLRTRITKGTP